MKGSIPTICGPFDRARYKRLKKAYTTALAANADQFKFEGQDMVTAFAKYVIEFLEMKWTTG